MKHNSALTQRRDTATDPEKPADEIPHLLAFLSLMEMHLAPGPRDPLTSSG
jgi:hypothetical protein